MTRFHLLVLPVLAALAMPLTASAWGFNRGGCDNGCNNGGCNNGGCNHGGHHGCFNGALANHPATAPQGLGFCQKPFQAAPWYLYWPYDAHFQLPAPIAAPYMAPQGFNTPWNPYFAAPPAPAGYPAPGGYPAPASYPVPGAPDVRGAAPRFGPAN
jgi:hypothetical protein